MSLPDLQKVVAEQFESLVQSGAIESMLSKTLEKTVDEAVKAEMREYSDFGKAIREKIKAALMVDDLADLPNYGNFISGIVRKNVDSQLHGAYAAKLADDLEKLFCDVPAEMTLEQLVADFKQHVKQDWRDHDHRMTLHLKEWDSGGFVVELDRKSRAERYSCEVQFQVNQEGSIYALRINKSDVSKDLFVGGLNSFERALFRMYVQGTKLPIPPGTTEDDFSLYYGEDD
jgi:hypothetical protein